MEEELIRLFIGLLLVTPFILFTYLQYKPYLSKLDD